MATTVYVLMIPAALDGSEPTQLHGVSTDAGTLMLRAEALVADGLCRAGAAPRLEWYPADSPFDLACWEATATDDGASITVRVERTDFRG